jgi:hypothetical protein
MFQTHLQILKMTKGEHSRITFAAGEHAYQPSSPLYAATGNNSVQLDIVLKDVDKLKTSWEMTFEEKLAAAELAKQKGNAFFAVSVSSYRKAAIASSTNYLFSKRANYHWRFDVTDKLTGCCNSSKMLATKRMTRRNKIYSSRAI